MESYGKLVLDGKVDAKKFESPKETKDTIVEPYASPRLFPLSLDSAISHWIHAMSR
jgi:hypothetical protein